MKPVSSQTKDSQHVEWLACAESPLYFLDNYCMVYDATEQRWIPFKLWPEQAKALKKMQLQRLIVILKARQLGITWLVLGFALWLMIFHPVATVLIFSKRDDEAVYLLGNERLHGMYDRLPEWMKARSIIKDSGHEFQLSNGSIARAFPTSAGDSYTATLVICDEFDLVPNQGQLMNAVKPTIDGGGRMILLSRSDNGKPESDFKKIYRAAKKNLNGWTPIFLPWSARPARDQAWYEAQKADILHRTGSLDDLHQQYPATDTEALAARTLDKRLSSEWLNSVYQEMNPLRVEKAPAIPGLEIYAIPEPGKRYLLGGDPAEGNPTSDDSSLTILEEVTGEEVCSLAGKYQPSTFGAHISTLATLYNGADALIERNNHGHAVLLWLRDNSKVRVIFGPDRKPGWHTTSVGKSYMYDQAADAFREGSTIVHSFSTLIQLQSIEGSSLSAPEGEHDDRATSFCLALLARTLPRTTRLAVAVA